MRKLFMIPLLALLAFTINSTSSLDKKERKFAAGFLKDTEKDFFKTTKNLSDAQLNFKPAPDKWSIADCMKHIATSESFLWQIVEDNLKQPANPEKRSDIKVTDDQMVKYLEDRSQKFQTSDNLKPENSKFATAQDAAAAFRTSRDKLISYVKSTQDDLRGHVIALPYGVYDAYQMILFISAHSNRHMQQVREVMADPNFPKQ